MSEGSTPLIWRVTRSLLHQIVRRAVHRGLENRELTDARGQPIRWLGPEIRSFLTALDAELEQLRADAGLETLPSFGNRLMVELAIYTVGADRVLRSRNISSASARSAVSDIGWGMYRRMLALTSLPMRLVTKDPGRRLRWTIFLLLRFPFNAPGAPGYAVDCRIDGTDILTNFTHCPPQSYARDLSEKTGDTDALEAFRQSWCRYDWPGADIIAGDGYRGHYRRRQTLSQGDPVCDMCWIARGIASTGKSDPNNGDPAG